MHLERGSHFHRGEGDRSEPKGTCKAEIRTNSLEALVSMEERGEWEELEAATCAYCGQAK
jgi:hypothetical protein